MNTNPGPKFIDNGDEIDQKDFSQGSEPMQPDMQ